MSTLEQYRCAQYQVPDHMLRWHLYGAGLDNLGRDGAPEEVAVPDYGPNELLVRQDACGLCFSDTKVITLGENHPRMTGRHLATDPVTLGHEVACTVVGVGDQLKTRFAVGDRFVVQADVFYRGKSMAYGYAIKGGLAEYSVIPEPVIDGDEGCYLLPIRPDTGYVASALTEPWACVVSAYAQAHRSGPKPGGSMLVIAATGDALQSVRWADLSGVDVAPARIVLLRLDGSPLDPGMTGSDHVIDMTSALGRSSIAGGLPDGFFEDLLGCGDPQGFDDILILGAVPPEVIETAATTLANHAVLNLVIDEPLPRKLSLDIGRIHYNWHYYVGTTDTHDMSRYPEERTSELLAGSIAWFIGAGGPMGQMHVQRAVQHRTPPRRIVATDLDLVRLQSVSDRFARLAAERGIELITLNPTDLGKAGFDEALRKHSDGRGYDDIVCMVPASPVIEHAADFLADGGWFNIFAGVARGTMAKLDVNRIIRNRCRFIGSSGSSLADMRETLARVEHGDLSTNASLAAIGGMAAAREGLQAVKEGWFPGKTLIFPLIHDLPLTPLAELKNSLPTVFALLEDGRFWTTEAEEELFRVKLG